VHLQLQNGDVKYTGIETNRETARRLAKHMYEPVRVFGTGRWLREEEGNWLLRKFRVDTYQILAADSLRAVIDQMRAVQGSEWQAMENLSALLRPCAKRVVACIMVVFDTSILLLVLDAKARSATGSRNRTACCKSATGSRNRTACCKGGGTDRVFD